MYQQQTWVSNSTIGDFLKCHRAYYLKNVYKNGNGKKISLINPYLTLGQVVHEVLESLTKIKSIDRFNSSLYDKLQTEWNNFSGELGGFTSEEEEQKFKLRAETMIKMVLDNPGPLLNKTLKLISPDSLPPRYLLSKEENIILCGKIDWLEYIPKDDSVHIIDFKTGKNDEDENSLQLSIYYLLVHNLQRRKVKKVSFWYIDREILPREMILPDLEMARTKVLNIAMEIKRLRQQGIYKCAKGGCYACRPLEEILEGKSKYICTKGYQDIYIKL